MSFIQTLKRILTIYNGGTPAPLPSQTVTNTTPQHNDSKETLAMKWEKILRESN
jgi:hypothetical protein